jgi:hypothetical protein
MKVDRGLSKIAHKYARTDFCEGQTQGAKVLKIVANRCRSVLLSSEVEAQRSLIRKRMPDHGVEGVCRIYKVTPLSLNKIRNGFECASM